MRELPRADLLPEAWQPVRDRLTPATTFSLTGRSRLLDDGRHGRSELRVTLDAEQASAALDDVRDVLLVRGPAGSGKSLILAARARWLAEKHPSWRIQMLCFNNALVPYLRSLVEDYPMVSVTTIGKFAAGNGHRLSFTDEASARRDLDRVRESIDLTVDALLIDEWQDFLPAWTEYALTTLFPGRGGAVVVADPQQSLYRDEVPLSGLNGHDVATVELNRPYRSTKQVLQTVQALHPGFHINGWEQAPDGEPVELIWAESALEQARAVAQDLTWLAQDGRPWSDMGVLVTQKWMIRPVARALHEAGVPHETIGKGQASTFPLRSNRVKLMTVHAAKGLEFGVAALLGLEHLKDPSESATTEDDRQARTRTARVGLVGPTEPATLSSSPTPSRTCFSADFARQTLRIGPGPGPTTTQGGISGHSARYGALRWAG